MIYSIRFPVDHRSSFAAFQLIFFILKKYLSIWWFFKFNTIVPTFVLLIKPEIQQFFFKFSVKMTGDGTWLDYADFNYVAHEILFLFRSHRAGMRNSTEQFVQNNRRVHPGATHCIIITNTTTTNNNIYNNNSNIIVRSAMALFILSVLCTFLGTLCALCTRNGYII